MSISKSKSIVKQRETSPRMLVITENDDGNDFHRQILNYDKGVPYKMRIVWRNVLIMSIVHLFGFYGYYLQCFYANWKSVVFCYLLANLAGFGVLIGAHRLWTHRAFKTHWTVRIVLMVLQTIALQNDVYEWVRDHRVHHKYSETDADPHNSNRGFFFAHIGWLLCRKHPDVISKGKQIDLSDILADPIVRFQHQFYIPLVLLLWGVFPVSVMYYIFNESLQVAIFSNFFRYIVSLHQAWLVNSAAHTYGIKPYDNKLKSSENMFVTYLSLGEGYHNYHHTFPWDYSASEHGWSTNFNVSTATIDLLAWIGLVTERRVVSKEMIELRVKRTGDSTLLNTYQHLNTNKWHVVCHYLIGTVITSWSLWLTFLISYLFEAS